MTAAHTCRDAENDEYAIIDGDYSAAIRTINAVRREFCPACRARPEPMTTECGARYPSPAPYGPIMRCCGPRGHAGPHGGPYP